MKRTSFSRAAGLGLVVLALLLAAAWTLTGRAPTARPPATSPDPRFAAVGDRFELVGALEGRRLTLWLDRFADNAPVTGATLEIEIGDAKLVGRAIDDRYEVELPAPPAPGVVPVTVTVTTADDMDLLAAELVVPAGREDSR